MNIWSEDCCAHTHRSTHMCNRSTSIFRWELTTHSLATLPFSLNQASLGISQLLPQYCWLTGWSPQTQRLKATIKLMVCGEHGLSWWVTSMQENAPFLICPTFSFLGCIYNSILHLHLIPSLQTGSSVPLFWVPCIKFLFWIFIYFLLHWVLRAARNRSSLGQVLS